MTEAITAHFYPPSEERINIVSHLIGLIFSVVGLVLLVVKAAALGTAIHVVSFAAFGAGLVTLYLASWLYHSATHVQVRIHLRTLDHASIYLLIAGSYTPFVLLVLPDTVGWVIFGVTWTMALIGIVTKLFYTGRFSHLSTAMYVFMGWIMVFAIKPLVENFSSEGLSWLIAGGVSYTVGALFYSIKRMPYGHATFHIFVLLGSISHFISVYFYILAPAET